MCTACMIAPALARAPPTHLEVGAGGAAAGIAGNAAREGVARARAARLACEGAKAGAQASLAFSGASKQQAARSPTPLPAGALLKHSPAGQVSAATHWPLRQTWPAGHSASAGEGEGQLGGHGSALAARRAAHPAPHSPVVQAGGGGVTHWPFWQIWPAGHSASVGAGHGARR